MDELIAAPPLPTETEDPPMSKSLNRSMLGALPEGVEGPSYDPAALRPGIVHVGVGNFHRAHQAVYLDALFSLGQDHDWAIVGAGVRPDDASMRSRLAAQDNLYTVIELAPEGHSARVVAPMIDFVEVTEGHGPLIERMAAPETRIVSLTVTEGGYYLDGTGAFDPDHPDMRHDADPAAAPRSVFGAILDALERRRAAGIAPFTVMSCDNLPGNGHVAKATLSGLASLRDAALGAWVRANVACPNGMVDRITPASSPQTRSAVAEEFGIDDAAPVTCEPYMQWVLEDDFPLGRPALEKVGVTFTDAVEAFETMKIRILNGGHAIIAYPSGLLGHELVSDAMADPRIADFLRAVEEREVLPVVPPVPGTELPDYLDLIVGRFSNPAVRDTIRRLCLDGSNRQPKFIVPSIRDNLAQGRMPEGLCLLSALWCRYCAGTEESGVEIAPNDPAWERLNRLALEARDRPEKWLSMRDVYGDLAQNEAFVSQFSAALAEVWSKGTAAAIAAYTES